MELWLAALLYGLFSASSLPLGAALGMYLKPSEKVTAGWMAVGSGALVFAVATQLYGESLFKLLIASEGPGCDKICDQRFKNVNVQNMCGILGALLYIGMNHWLAKLMSPKPSSASREVGDRNTRSGESLETGGASSQRDLGLPARRPSGIMARQASGVPIAALKAFRTASQGPQATAPRLAEEGAELGPAWCRAASQRLQAPRLPSALEDGPPRPLSPPLLDATAAEAPQSLDEEEEHAPNVALSMWLGLMLDGIPESLMLGFMTNEGTIQIHFLVAVLLANFPEAFAGGPLLKSQGMSTPRIMAMWMTVFLMTGMMAMVGSLIMPVHVAKGSILERVRDLTTSASEGLTGGAMLAMIATAMLPEAFKGAGEMAGILFVLGFALSVFINGLGARFGNMTGV
mmetsp:Transcript_8895/g.22941  ORF Transcript_8895/g.22941 Transcript_8895/m.22941 type:complete len:402 (-) Transcript_8895:89-1294(-)